MHKNHRCAEKSVSFSISFKLKCLSNCGWLRLSLRSCWIALRIGELIRVLIFALLVSYSVSCIRNLVK